MNIYIEKVYEKFKKNVIKSDELVVILNKNKNIIVVFIFNNDVNLHYYNGVLNSGILVTNNEKICDEVDILLNM